MPKPDFADLDRQRLRLEENAERLRKGLKHWRVLDAEYEGMKEEILAGKTYPTIEDLEAIGKEIGGSLSDGKETRDLVGGTPGVQRTSTQIVEILSRRIDYVQQNAQTIEKQLVSIEGQLENLSSTDSQPNEPAQSNLPLTEIIEELDEEGNVISSSTSTTADAAPEVLEALRAAGVKEKDLGEPKGSVSSVQQDAEKLPTRVATKPADTAQSPEPVSTPSRPVRPPPRSKSVSFSDDTKEAHDTEPTATPHSTTVPRIRPTYWNSRTPITLVNDDESPPVIPVDDSPEDDLLRKQMLDYGLSEVGAVVAELQLDEDVVSEDGGEIDDDDWEDETEDEDEDEHGRTKKRVLDDKYRAEMEALGRKLRNIGPTPVNVDSVANPAEDLDDSKQRRSSSAEKTVRFADELDIASEPPQQQTYTPARSALKPERAPIKDAVIERQGTKVSDSTSTPQRKSSRFKSARTDGKAPDDPSNPGKNPLAANLIERQPSTPVKAPVDLGSGDSDTEDPTLLRQQIATEYHAQRSRRIQKQGGFLAGPEDGMEEGDETREVRVPLDREGTEKPEKKKSRFMAARLSGPS